MKKITISDKVSDNKNQWHVIVKYSDGCETLTDEHMLCPNDFVSSHEDLNWYYSDYLLRPLGYSYKKAQMFTASMIERGKALANKLFNDKLNTILNTSQFNDIFVSIESSSNTFLAFPWEMLHLSMHPKPLSVLGTAFIRTILPSQDTVVYALDENNTLNALLISPRPYDCIDIPLCCSPDHITSTFLEMGDAVNLATLSTQGIEKLKTQLEQTKDHPFHLIHFNGYVTNHTDSSNPDCLVFESENGSSEFIPIETFSQILKQYNIETIFLDVAPYKKDKSIDSNTSIDVHLAQTLLTSGIKNIITTSFGHYAVYAQRFYAILLSSLAEGLNLNCAVVKARNVIREHASQAVLTTQAVEFLDWLIINHYSTQDITFFSETLTLKPMPENEYYQSSLKNCIGFDPELLVRGFLGQTHEVRDVDRTLQKNKIALITGANGIGKTHFVHHYALEYLLNKTAVYALYFDFRTNSYTKHTLLQIIGDVLPDKNLEEQPILFVLDNIDVAHFSSESEQKELFDFLEHISSESSSVILTSKVHIKKDDAYYHETCLKGLNEYDRRQFASSILRKYKCEEEENAYGYFDLVDSLEGQPFITQILLPAISDNDPIQIKESFFSKLQQITGSENLMSSKTIIALFEYGWEKCDHNAQKVIWAFKDYQGYITEGMVISVDKKVFQAQKNEFFSSLGVDERYSFAKAFALACNIGLFLKKEFGYVIHPETKFFLDSKQKQFDAINQSSVASAVSKLFIIELQMLCVFLSQHQERKLYQIIAQNYSRWLNALSLLWQESAFKAFDQGLDYLYELFLPIGLKNVLETWAFTFIKQQSFDLSQLQLDEAHAASWLQTATYALGVVDPENDREFVHYVSSWQAQLLLEQNLALFNRILMFLEAFYRKKNDWQARKTLSEQALSFYQKKQLFDKVILSMFSLAKCAEALGDIEQAKTIEHNMLIEIPFDSLPQDAKQETMLKLAMNKVRRQEYNDAKALAEQVKTINKNEAFNFIADTVLADIVFKKEEYLEATEIYAHLWKTVMQEKKPMGQREQHLIALRLKEISEKLDEESFTSIYGRIAGDIKTPMALEAEYRQRHG